MHSDGSPLGSLLVCAALGHLAGGCVEAPDVASQDRPVSVTWVNQVGVTANGNDLVKTDTSSTWQAGASSSMSIDNEGFVEFTTNEDTTAKMAGLSNGDASRSRADIDFAIALRSSGLVAIHEGGVVRAVVGPYRAGDTFRVEVVAGVVRYRQNGTLLYTSAVAPTFPLLVDTSLSTPGATISDADIVLLQSWQNAVGVSTSSYSVTKTAENDTWTAGAASVATIAGDGYLEFRASGSGTAKAAGLSNGDNSQHRTDIDFAFYFAVNGNLFIYENGVDRGLVGTYGSNDYFRVSVVDDVVSYWKNGALLYTSGLTPAFPLGVDTALRSPGANVRDIQLSASEAVTYVKASSPTTWDYFGVSVSLSGDTLAVGAPTQVFTSTGAVYVFVRAGDTWVQQARLVASNAENEDLFGWSVALSGDRLVVGAPGEDSSATGVNGNQSSNAAPGSGAAYVFERSGTTWTQQAYVKASNTDPDDGFGTRVAISGDTFVVGAPWRTAAYVFSGAGGTWSQQAFLTGSTSFGDSVAISGDTVAVGTWRLNHERGAVDVYTRSGAVWTAQQRLEASYPKRLAHFGSSLSLDGDTLAIGAQYEPSIARAAGAAYVFTRDGTIWTEQAFLRASNAQLEDLFGTGVALSGDTLVVTAFLEDSRATRVDGDQHDDSAPDSGAAYVFTWDGASWSESAYLKASNTEAGDNFGLEVPAVSGGTVVVGAPSEDGAAGGIDGDQSSNNAESAGAVYIYQLP